MTPRSRQRHDFCPRYRGSRARAKTFDRFRSRFDLHPELDKSGLSTRSGENSPRTWPKRSPHAQHFPKSWRRRRARILPTRLSSRSKRLGIILRQVSPMDIASRLHRTRAEHLEFIFALPKSEPSPFLSITLERARSDAMIKSSRRALLIEERPETRTLGSVHEAWIPAIIALDAFLRTKPHPTKTRSRSPT